MLRNTANKEERQGLLEKSTKIKDRVTTQSSKTEEVLQKIDETKDAAKKAGHKSAKEYMADKVSHETIQKNAECLIAAKNTFKKTNNHNWSSLFSCLPCFGKRKETGSREEHKRKGYGPTK